MVGNEARLLGLLAVSVIASGAAAARILVKLGLDRNRHGGILALFGIGDTVLTAYAAWVGLPVPVVLSVFFLLLMTLLYVCREDFGDFILLGLLGYLSYAALLLSFLGIAGMADGDVMEMAGFMDARTWVLIGTKLAMALICILPVEGVVAVCGSDRKRMMGFKVFLCCCVLYTMGDAFLCRTVSSGNYIPLLLVSGNFLLFIFFIIFLYHNYLLEKNQYLAEEHERIEAERAREQYRANHLRQLSDRDALTGAYSRRYALERLKEWGREGKGFSLAYIDLDGLKMTNDTEGHDAGDRFLKRFAAGMIDRIGGSGFLARIGGDEFLALFPGSDDQEAVGRMEAIRADMEQRHDGWEPVAFSFGVVSGNDDLNALIRQADSKMYVDKKQRKERVRHV